MSRQTSRGEAPVALVCETFGISRAAWYAARKPAVASSASERAPRPRGTPVADLLLAIEAVVAKHQTWGVRKVWATLKRSGMRVGRRRVWALMKAHGHVLPGGVPREATPRRGQVVVPEPNRRPTSQDAPSMLASVDNALVAAFGHPRNVPDGVELRSDHGSVYTGADAHAFALRWGVVPTFAPVGRPTGNAVAERTLRTMNEECVWLEDWRNALTCAPPSMRGGAASTSTVPTRP